MATAKKQRADTVEFFEALRLLEKEKGIPADYLMEKIRNALITAVNKEYGCKDNVEVVMDPEKGVLSVALRKTVVEEVEIPELEILPAAAKKYKRGAKVGDVVTIPLETMDFGRIAAQSAKHVIRQGVREAEKNQMFAEFRRHNQEMVSVLVTRVDPTTGNATVELGKAEAMLPRSEQIDGEEIRPGMRLKIYVVDVKDTEKGPRVYISRTHSGLVKRLFENEVPEIFDGTIEIKAIAREAGSRTKMAVAATKENVDAVGSCIGVKGARVNAVMAELGGEKIDIVNYSDDPAAFIAAALLPARVLSVTPDPEGARACQVTVPESQLSLAIGNKGQNARLAVRLTGWKIDIHPESGFFGE